VDHAVKHLPERLRAKLTSSGKTYYYYDCGKGPDGKRRWKALGANYVEAMRQWAEYEVQSSKPVVTFRQALGAYFKSQEFKEKAPRTQKDYLTYGAQLLDYFDDPPAPLDEIETHHLQAYHERRSKTAPVPANRELALFSVVWNFARRFGHTNKPNPKPGVRRNTETRRKVYVEHGTFFRLCRCADPVARDVLRLAYLTGQRPADVMELDIGQIRGDTIHVAQNKTDATLDIVLSPRLKVVVRSCMRRRQRTKAKSMHLFVNEKGEPFTYSAMDNRFDDIRRRAGVSTHEVQLRDLRAKAGTDVKVARGLEGAQQLLGHKNVKTTEIYVRSRKGDRVKPTR
jgi:integrase